MDRATTPATAVAHLRGGIGRLAYRGGIIAVSSQLVILVLQLGSTMVLARLLVPDDFGLIAMMAVFSGAAALFQEFGLSQATIQNEDLSEPQLSSLFWLNLALGIVFALLLLALSPLISSLYGRPELVGIAAIAALALLPQAANVQHRALLVRQMRFGALRLAEVSSVAAGVALAIVMAALDYGYWSLAFMPLASATTFAVLAWPTARWMPGRPRRADGMRDLVRFGLDVTAFNGLNFLSRNADDLLIGWAWGASALGFYSRAYELMMMPLRLLNVPLSNVAIPALSRLVGDEDRYREAYRRMVEKILLVGLPVVGVLIGTADWVIELMLGPGWDEAAAIFVWLGIAALYQPLAHSTGWLFISQGRTREFARWGLISSLLNVTSFVVGLPFGSAGVAVSYALIGLFVRLPILFWLVGRRGPVHSRLMWHLLFTFLPLGLGAGLISLSAHFWFGSSSALQALIGTVAIVALVTLLTLATIPVYRNSASDLLKGPKT